MKKNIFLFCFIFLVTLPALAIYKWTDSDGIVHFTDLPPIGEAEFEDVNLQKDPATLSDYFGDDLLSKAWLKSNVLNPEIFSEKNDKLIIVSPGNTDLWYGTFTAPVLYKKIDSKLDFLLEVKLGFKTNGSDKGGIVIWTDEGGKNDFIVLCKSKNEDINYRRITGDIAEKGTEPGYANDSIIFRLKKEENIISASYSGEGTDWTDLGMLALPSGRLLNLGLFGCSWKSSPAVVSFDYFEVKPK